MSHSLSRFGGRRRSVLGLLLASGLAAGGYLLFRPAPPPLPPGVELAGVDHRVADAVRKADKKVREAPLSGASWGRLGQVLIANEFYPEGLTCLARAEELDPLNPRWPYLQASINPRTSPGTASKLRRAVAICRPENALALRLRLAECLLDNVQLDAAAAEFRQSLEVAPNNPWGQLGLARTAFARDDFSTALAALGPHDGRPSSVRENLPTAFATLHAAILHRMGTPPGAEKRAAPPMPKDPGPPDPFVEEMTSLAVGLKAEIKRVDQLLQGGNVSAALGTLRDLVEEYPEADLAWLYLGRAWVSAGNVVEAEKALRNAIRLSPNSAFALALLGNVNRQAGRAAEAAECFRLALVRQPSFWPACVSLAESLETAGDWEGAVKMFRDAQRLAPQNPHVHASAGRLLARLGRNAEAAAALRNAVSIDPDDSKSRTLLAEIEAGKSLKQP